MHGSHSHQSRPRRPQPRRGPRQQRTAHGACRGSDRRLHVRRGGGRHRRRLARADRRCRPHAHRLRLARSRLVRLSAVAPAGRLEAHLRLRPLPGAGRLRQRARAVRHRRLDRLRGDRAADDDAAGLRRHHGGGRRARAAGEHRRLLAACKAPTATISIFAARPSTCSAICSARWRRSIAGARDPADRLDADRSPALDRRRAHHRAERLAGGGGCRAYPARRRARGARYAGDRPRPRRQCQRRRRRCTTCMSGRSPRAGAW